ncbi:MAG: hypothetical protein ACT4P0_07785 [Panacagrimonas sp.]
MLPAATDTDALIAPAPLERNVDANGSRGGTESRRVSRQNGRTQSLRPSDLGNSNTGSGNWSLGPDRGWIPSFGQCGAALRHLQLCGVNRGDVFLFFGWFRRVDLSHGTWRYVRGAPNLHLIFGWLEVGEFVDLVSHRDQLVERAPWASRHPHVDDARYNQIRGGNGLYIAAAKSRLAPHAAFGAGQFAHYSQTLQLTDASSVTRSVWSLPGWFHPSGSRRAPQITFHEDVSRWKRKDGRAILQTVAKGQEFVFSTDAYPQALSWVRRLVGTSALNAC